MSWHCKPRGGYALGSQEAYENIMEIYGNLSGSWTVEAIAGMIANMVHESGLNPWRWQSDVVNYSGGYGLAQFTPASGYILHYGKTVTGYSPNLSVSEVSSGTYSDAIAQLTVINFDLANKFIDRRGQCTYTDLTNTYPFSKYKHITDLWKATVGWLYNYEAPYDKSYEVATTRYASARIVYEYLTGVTPPPPTPPSPVPPIPPEPTPPVPPFGVKKKSLPVYMMIRNRNERRI